MINTSVDIKQSKIEVLCNCGCGNLMPCLTAHGETRRYILGHNWIGKNRIFADPKTRNKKISIANTGRVCSDKTREKLRLAGIGRIFSKETRMKISTANLGRICSKKIRQKISRSCLGRLCSDETRKKLSIAQKKYTSSEEARKKIGMVSAKIMNSEKMKEKFRARLLKKNPININYFKTLNRKNAYILGYLFADGSLRKGKRNLRLSFSSIDRELIDKIKDQFSVIHRKVSVRKGKNIMRDGKSINCKDSYSMTIWNYHFLRHLINQGMISGRKEHRIFIPKDISKNKKFFAAFFRGFFDGDGTVRSIKTSQYPAVSITSASYKFLIQMKNLMRKFGIISWSLSKNKTSRTGTFGFSGKQNVYNLYKLMYKNSNNLFLSRKKQRFDEFFKSYGWKLV